MDMSFRSDRLKTSCLPSWLVDALAGAAAVAMPPPFSPLFVRLLFAISFFRAQSEDSPRAGFRVSASCQYDLNDASQKGKFPRGSSSSSGGTAFPLRDSKSNQPCRQATIHRRQSSRLILMPAGWVSVV